MSKNKKVINDFDTMRKFALGGALTVKSTELIGGAGCPDRMWDTAGGMFGIGIAGATSDIAMGMITGKYKRKKKKRR